MSNFFSPALPSLAPPELWDQLDITAYFAVGTAGMALWDFLSHLEDDYLILHENTYTIPAIVYIISRLSMLGVALADATFQTMSTTKCDAINYAMETFLFVSVSSTNLLFYLRLKAIYKHNRTVINLFFVLWVLTTGCTILIFWAGEVDRIFDPVSQDSMCIYSKFNLGFGTPPLNAILIYDTLVFLAVSYRLYFNSYFGLAMSNSDAQSDFSLHLTRTISKTKEFISGRHLPAFSRALLRDGQIYYLISLLATVITNILFYLPMLSIPGMKDTPGLRLMLIIPHATIINAMSCHAFRQIRFGRKREDSLPFINFSLGNVKDLQTDVDRESIEENKGELPSCYVHRTVDVHVDEAPTSLPNFATSGRMYRRATVSEAIAPSIRGS